MGKPSGPPADRRAVIQTGTARRSTCTDLSHLLPPAAPLQIAFSHPFSGSTSLGHSRTLAPVTPSSIARRRPTASDSTRRRLFGRRPRLALATRRVRPVRLSLFEFLPATSPITPFTVQDARRRLPLSRPCSFPEPIPSSHTCQRPLPPRCSPTSWALNLRHAACRTATSP